MEMTKTASVIPIERLGFMAGRTVLLCILLIVGWWCGWGPGTGSAEVTATSRILPAGDALELTYQSNGDTWRDLLPIHRAGPVRYFSAGVGMAERAAEYPPFPLKLVLTAGGKPYVARVGLEVMSHDGTITLSIPSRYVHTVNEMAAMQDIDGAIRLLARFLEEAGSRSYGYEL